MPEDRSSDIRLDKDDSSVCRSKELFRHLFEQGGFHVLLEQAQQDWPDYMIPVTMWALVPCRES